MSEFHAEEIFPVSSFPNPYVVGRVVGDFAVGQRVVLRKEDNTTYRGVLEGLEIHMKIPGKGSFMFSAGISQRIEPGDVVYDLPADQGGMSPR
ncbi:hypothetical protein [Nocardia brevicatena]|uniref:hypothetical protein n=1 Tax=Nocardia brevicatena TaxID=37327 RepID=UPI0002EB8140|nr:hypothetical protein [Nocardia brevicatena]